MLTIEQVRKIKDDQSKNPDGAVTLQYMMAEDILKLYKKIEELEVKISEWEEAGYKN